MLNMPGVGVKNYFILICNCLSFFIFMYLFTTCTVKFLRKDFFENLVSPVVAIASY